MSQPIPTNPFADVVAKGLAAEGVQPEVFFQRVREWLDILQLQDSAWFEPEYDSEAHVPTVLSFAFHCYVDRRLYANETRENELDNQIKNVETWKFMQKYIRFYFVNQDRAQPMNLDLVPPLDRALVQHMRLLVWADAFSIQAFVDASFTEPVVVREHDSFAVHEAKRVAEASIKHLELHKLRAYLPSITQDVLPEASRRACKEFVIRFARSAELLKTQTVPSVGAYPELFEHFVAALAHTVTHRVIDDLRTCMLREQQRAQLDELDGPQDETVVDTMHRLAKLLIACHAAETAF